MEKHTILTKKRHTTLENLDIQIPTEQSYFQFGNKIVSITPVYTRFMVAGHSTPEKVYKLNVVSFYSEVNALEIKKFSVSLAEFQVLYHGSDNCGKELIHDLLNLTEDNIITEEIFFKTYTRTGKELIKDIQKLSS